jgi:Flp pilus assembly pilin Flp
MTRLRTDASGQDLLEYAMLIALIVVISVGTVTQVGLVIKTAFWDSIVAANI